MTVRDYLNDLAKKHSIDFKVAEGNVKKYPDGWSKWRPLSRHYKEMRVDPNYRFPMPSELIVEHDFPARETNYQVAMHIKKLFDEKGVAYQIWFSGGKSYHNHSFWIGLEKIPPEKRKKARKLLLLHLTNNEIAKTTDESNFNNETLIQIKETPHRKTRKLKTLVCERSGKNYLPQEIAEEALKEPEKTFEKKYDTPATCTFLEYVLENKIGLQNVQQNSGFSPNAFAYFKGNEKMLQRLVDTQQQENLTVARIKCWEQHKPEFRCDQLQFFVKKVGLKKICECCTLRKPIGKEWKTINLINTARRLDG